ncbi:MAG: hypothetical protein WD851_09765 [Pirellulales bacterium]
MDIKAESDWGRRCTAAVLAVLSICLGAYVVVFVLPVFYRRLTFPGVLEHQESMTIFLLHRMSQGVGNLYQMPSLHTGSVIYNPAYFFYLWALHPIIGDHAVPIRIASVVPPLLLCAVLIEIIGRKQMHLRWLGVAWAFVSLALYPLVTWIDLARLEAMLLLSIVLVWYTLCLDDNWRPKWVLVGLAVAFSFAVKQPGALFVAAPLMLAIVDRRYLISVATAIGGIAAFVAAMVLWFGEPYLYFAFTEPSRHPLSIGQAVEYLQDIVALAPLILFGPLITIIRGFDLGSSHGKLLLVSTLTFLISAMGAGKAGGSLTQYVIMLLVAAIPAAEWLRLGVRGFDRASTRFGIAVCIVLAYSILITEVHDYGQRVRPRRLDREQQAALLEVVRSVPGETWVTTWTHIDLWAKHPVFAPLSPVGFSMAEKEIEDAIRSRRFSLIVISPAREKKLSIVDLVKSHYHFCFSMPMRDFGSQLFLPTEVWARSAEERELVLKAKLE